MFIPCQLDDWGLIMTNEKIRLISHTRGPSGEIAEEHALEFDRDLWEKIENKTFILLEISDWLDMLVERSK